jgi:hypothetical protein
MTGHGNTSSTTGEPPKFSNTPNVSAGTGTGTGTGTDTGTDTGLGEQRHAGHIGTDGPIGGPRVAGTSEDSSHHGNNSRLGDNSGLGDNSRLEDSSHLRDNSQYGDGTRPHVSSGTYDGNSDASIKSGVIGFTTGSGGQGHAALPTSNVAEDRLDRNHIVGQGSTGSNTGSGLRNETINEQQSTLPRT